jgi:hypothetical protein
MAPIFRLKAGSHECRNDIRGFRLQAEVRRASSPALLRKPSAGVTHAPFHHCPQDRPELFTLRRQPVFDPGRVIAVPTGRDDAGLDEPLQSIRKDVGRNAFRRTEELGKASLASDQIANHQERPSIADDIQGARDGAS